MPSDGLQIDQLLASVLRGEAVGWPDFRTGSEGSVFVFEQIQYHGVAGLLANSLERLIDWPIEIIHRIREQGIAQAMWELRHRAVLSELLASFALESIIAIVLKGTAVAYDLYQPPATRARGDTDLLIAPDNLDQARAALQQLGYRRQLHDDGNPDALSLQEVWSFARDGGSQHHIDLHWQLLNSPALTGVLPYSECLADAMPLPRLCRDAFAMDRLRTLIHTCVHRSMHVTAPYFVDGVTYYGGNRLIWARDIHLLAAALSETEWTKLCALARQTGVAAACLDGLMTAQRLLATEFPEWVRKELGSASAETPAFNYLRHSHQLARAWQDVRSTSGWRRKLAYLRARLLPSPAFIRGKYPKMEGMPLALLYARRMIDLVRVRPRRSVS